MSQTGTISQMPPLSSILSQLGEQFSDMNDYGADDAMADAFERKLNFQSACTLKAMAPLMQIVSTEQVKGLDDVEAAKLSRDLVNTCRRNSAEVCSALEISENSMVWARSYYSGAIAHHIANIWPRAGRAALDVNWAVTIAELAKPLLLDGLPPNWREADIGVSMTATVINAVQELMTEYNKFNLFHRDRGAIENEFSTLLIKAAIEQVDMIAEDYPMSQDSKCSLAQSLIKNGGSILANLWHSYSRQAVHIYKDKASDTLKKRLGAEGFPLEDIKLSFSSQMTNLGALSLKTMNAASSLADEASPANETSMVLHV